MEPSERSRDFTLPGRNGACVLSYNCIPGQCKIATKMRWEIIIIILFAQIQSNKTQQ